MRVLLIRLLRSFPQSMRRRLIWLSQPTFTVGVTAIILNDRDQVLLATHRLRDEHGWQLPGGFVKRGEDIESALKREIHEETGYDIEVEMQVRTRVSRPLHMDVCYRCRYLGRSADPDEQEISEATFFWSESLPEGILGAHAELIALALHPAGTRLRY